MERKYNLSREMYRGIKKMDAEEMGAFLSNVFQEGYNSAVTHTETITIDDLHTAIAAVKGIGERRMQEIDNAIRKLFEERNGNHG